MVSEKQQNAELCSKESGALLKYLLYVTLDLKLTWQTKPKKNGAQK